MASPALTESVGRADELGRRRGRAGGWWDGMWDKLTCLRCRAGGEFVAADGVGGDVCYGAVGLVIRCFADVRPETGFRTADDEFGECVVGSGCAGEGEEGN